MSAYLNEDSGEVDTGDLDKLSGEEADEKANKAVLLDLAHYVNWLRGGQILLSGTIEDAISKVRARLDKTIVQLKEDVEKEKEAVRSRYKKEDKIQKKIEKIEKRLNQQVDEINETWGFQEEALRTLNQNIIGILSNGKGKTLITAIYAAAAASEGQYPTICVMNESAGMVYDDNKPAAVIGFSYPDIVSDIAGEGRLVNLDRLFKKHEECLKNKDMEGAFKIAEEIAAALNDPHTITVISVDPRGHLPNKLEELSKQFAYYQKVLEGLEKRKTGVRIIDEMDDVTGGEKHFIVAESKKITENRRSMRIARKAAELYSELPEEEDEALTLEDGTKISIISSEDGFEKDG
jgi:gas vesicle protein